MFFKILKFKVKTNYFMSEKVIIECLNCGNSFRGDISKPFICPKCIEKGFNINSLKESKTTSVLKKVNNFKENTEDNNIENKENDIKKTENSIVNNEKLTKYDKISNINSVSKENNNLIKSNINNNNNNNNFKINNINNQINDILNSKKPNENNKTSNENKDDNINSFNEEVLLKLDRLEAKYSILESLLKEIILKLS